MTPPPTSSIRIRTHARTATMTPAPHSARPESAGSASATFVLRVLSSDMALDRPFRRHLEERTHSTNAGPASQQLSWPFDFTHCITEDAAGGQDLHFASEVLANQLLTLPRSGA